MTKDLDELSKRRLQGVHPDLVKVVDLARTICPIDFAVTEGVRSLERQKQLFADGKSKTLNSRHLTGHAVDLVVKRGKEVSWEKDDYKALASWVKEAAMQLNIPIRWGGDFKTFFDGPHFELLKEEYP